MNLQERTRKLAQGIKASIGRFPITVLFAVALTVIGIVLNHNDDAFSDRTTFFLVWYLATGMFLSLGLALYCEERKADAWRHIIPIAGMAVWAGVWILLSRYEDNIGDLPYVLIFAALIALSVISVFLLPFLGDKDDMPMWNFTLRVLCAAALACCVGLVLWGGLSLLLLSLEKLFNFDIRNELYEDMGYISMVLATPLLILQAIPSADAKHDSKPMRMPAFIRNAVFYLFIPLTVLYFVTLYCYAAKILITWNLPEGWVSYLVSASMVLTMLLQMALRPYKEQPAGYRASALKLVYGWLPKLMLPLLLLMSVGIVRRVSDYGITVSRVYLIIFNLWCYAVCIILWLRKSDKVMWMPVSVVLLFILLSVFPVNVSVSVKNSMLRQVRSALAEKGWFGSEMTDEEYSNWLAGIDRETAFRIDSRLDYLHDKYPGQVTEGIIGRGVLTGRIKKTETDADADADFRISCYRGLLRWKDLSVPEGMSNVIRYAYRENTGNASVSGDSLTAKFNLYDDIESEQFEITFLISDLRALAGNAYDLPLSEHVFKYEGKLDSGASCIFYLNEFDLWSDGKDEYSMRIEGLLFH